MKAFFIVLICLISMPLYAADETLIGVYGGPTVCTNDDDADTGEDNRLGPFMPGKTYTIMCHDGAASPAFVACECLAGPVTVDATTGDGGLMLGVGEKYMFTAYSNTNYVSCVPYADNQEWRICRNN